MLVLTRKLSEQIVIGDDTVVEVLQIGRDKVRLGIVAPIAVPVHRREVLELIEADQRNAGRIGVNRTLPAPRKPTPFADRLASLADEAHRMGDRDTFLTLAAMAERIKPGVMS